VVKRCHWPVIDRWPQKVRSAKFLYGEKLNFVNCKFCMFIKLQIIKKKKHPKLASMFSNFHSHLLYRNDGTLWEFMDSLPKSIYRSRSHVLQRTQPCAEKPAGVVRLLWRVCQSLHKYSHHSRFQAAKVRSLNVELGRNEPRLFFQAYSRGSRVPLIPHWGFQSVATW